MTTRKIPSLTGYHVGKANPHMPDMLTKTIDIDNRVDRSQSTILVKAPLRSCVHCSDRPGGYTPLPECLEAIRDMKPLLCESIIHRDRSRDGYIHVISQREADSVKRRMPQTEYANNIKLEVLAVISKATSKNQYLIAKEICALTPTRHSRESIARVLMQLVSDGSIYCARNIKYYDVYSTHPITDMELRAPHRDAFLALYMQGMSLTRISGILNLSYKVLCLLLDDATQLGIDMSGRPTTYTEGKDTKGENANAA